MSRHLAMKHLPLFAAALWWGSLTTIAMVVPQLFAHLPTPALAGQTAAKLFTTQNWVSIVCCMGLLICATREVDGRRLAPDGALMAVLGGLLLALVNEFGVAPHIVARDNLRLWHNVGTGLYALQWALAGYALWRARK